MIASLFSLSVIYQSWILNTELFPAAFEKRSFNTVVRCICTTRVSRPVQFSQQMLGLHPSIHPSLCNLPRVINKTNNSSDQLNQNNYTYK